MRVLGGVAGVLLFLASMAVLIMGPNILEGHVSELRWTTPRLIALAGTAAGVWIITWAFRRQPDQAEDDAPDRSV